VPTEKNPVLWLLDEYAHIGAMRTIEEAVTLKRGMGMRLWFFFQSLEQLRTCFGEHAATVLDNIGTQQYFGLTSYATCEELSKRVGEATIAIRTVNDSASDSYSTGSAKEVGSGNRSSSRAINYSEIARRLLKPEEMLTLPQDTTLIFHANLPVTIGRLVKYFNAPEFRWRRCGRQRGIGLAASLMAVFTLSATLVMADVAEHLPPVPARWMATTFSARHSSPRPLPARRPAVRSKRPIRPTPRAVLRRRRYSPHELPSRSGYLIPIR
jgi:type IV secretion system protein VirD4